MGTVYPLAVPAPPVEAADLPAHAPGTGYAPPMARAARKSPSAPAPLRAEAGIEPLLHASCVKAGAAAALQVALDRLPLLRPMLPRAITNAARGDAPERIQRLLVKEIYARYHVRPAGWEIEGILAVAQTQSVLTPLATQEGLKGLMRAWVPDSVSSPLIRFTPLEPLVMATAKAIAATWAAGRYADSVCRLRRAGADWLPAPLAEAMNLAPAKLRRWSTEALTLALPPLRLATRWGLRAAEAATPALLRAVVAAPAPVPRGRAKQASRTPAQTDATKIARPKPGDPGPARRGRTTQ
jgi:hypothetical protein